MGPAKCLLSRGSRWVVPSKTHNGPTLHTADGGAVEVMGWGCVRAVREGLSEEANPTRSRLGLKVGKQLRNHLKAWKEAETALCFPMHTVTYTKILTNT